MDGVNANCLALQYLEKIIHQDDLRLLPILSGPEDIIDSISRLRPPIRREEKDRPFRLHKNIIVPKVFPKPSQALFNRAVCKLTAVSWKMLQFLIFQVTGQKAC